MPKHLNSPETAAYKKGSLLFGLDHARLALAQEATPVIVEGPFDALAVTLADPSRHAGLAPCGTALTSQQAELLSQAVDLQHAGILVAFDAEPAGRKAANRAYEILRQHTGNFNQPGWTRKTQPPSCSRTGNTLRAVLREHREPLSALSIDAHIEQRKCHIGDTEGRYRTMRSAASLIARLLPDPTKSQISQLMGFSYAGAPYAADLLEAFGSLAVEVNAGDLYLFNSGHLPRGKQDHPSW